MSSKKGGSLKCLGSIIHEKVEIDKDITHYMCKVDEIKARI